MKIDKERSKAELVKAFEKAMEQESAKYKPMHDWYKAHQEKPKNLYEAVMRRESFKEVCISVFGEY